MTTANSTPSADSIDWLRLLLVPGVPAATQRALLRAFGSPRAVLAASPDELEARFDACLASALARGASNDAVEAACTWLQGAERRLVTLGDPDYPPALLQTSDPPVALYVRGRAELLQAPAIAIVGSRNATAQGMRDAEDFAQALSEAGLLIVSGLALGIDAAAHRGGLRARGSSLAVLGTGPDRIYPSRNLGLADSLARHGALVTEYPVGTAPLPGNFPRRNRLIAGLARSVLVVEGALESGSLITARLALEEGRDVFALPGSIHAPLAKGCNRLIKQGAALVENIVDILAELGLKSPRALGHKPQSSLSVSEPLLEIMGFDPISIDGLAARSGLAAGTIAARLAELEIEGRIASLSGGRFQRLSPR